MAKIEIYDSLDAPVSVWINFHKENDLSCLLKKKAPLTESLLIKLNEAWEKMYDEYLGEFGFTDSYKNILQKEIDIALFRCKLIETDDRAYETEIEIAELELADLKKGVGKSDFMEAKIAIEREVLKFQLNMNSTSIREFYGYLKQLN